MCTLEQYENEFDDRHLLHGVIEKWATEKPDEIGLICADDEREFSWKDIHQSATAIAIKLTEMGLKKGDFLATSLPSLPEHIWRPMLTIPPAERDVSVTSAEQPEEIFVGE